MAEYKATILRSSNEPTWRSAGIGQRVRAALKT
jgi:hypothetical protein